MGKRGPKPLPPEVRFARHIANLESGCIEWVGGKFSNGYGAFHPGPSALIPGAQKKILAHRWAYEHAVGPVPDGMQLDHLCRNRSCVNPDHLEPVTPAENQARAAKARITECPQGHPYTEENTLLSNGGRHRRCRACTTERENLRAPKKNALRRKNRREQSGR